MPSPNELLGRAIFVLFKRKWLLLFSTAFFLAAILFGVYLIDPKVKATSLILVKPGSQQQMIMFPGMETPGQRNMQVNPARNMVELSGSRGMAAEVVERFKLAGPKELDNLRDYVKYYGKQVVRSPITLAEVVGLKEKPPKDYEGEAIRDLLSDVDIEVQQDTEILELTVWGDTPELATGIANAMSNLLVARTRAIAQQKAKDAFAFAKEQVEKSNDSLAWAETQLLEHRLESHITSLEQQKKLMLEQLDAIETRARATMADLSDAKARVTATRQLLDSLDATVLDQSVDAANPVLTALRDRVNELKARLASAKTEKTEDHPEVAELSAQIEQLHAELEGEEELVAQSRTLVANPIRRDLELQLAHKQAEVAALQAKHDTWTQEMGALQEQLAQLARNEATLNALLRSRNQHEDRTANLQKKLLELEVQQLTQFSDFDIRIIDPAQLSPKARHDYPDWEFATYISVPMAILLGLLTVFGVEYFRDEVDDPRQLAAIGDLNVFGRVKARRAVDVDAAFRAIQLEGTPRG